MSTEADIVERLRKAYPPFYTPGQSDALTDAIAEITKLRAERDVAARDMRDLCAIIAERFYDVDVPSDQEHARDTGLLAGKQIAAAIRTIDHTTAVIATVGGTKP